MYRTENFVFRHNPNLSQSCIVVYLFSCHWKQKCLWYVCLHFVFALYSSMSFFHFKHINGIVVA